MISIIMLLGTAAVGQTEPVVGVGCVPPPGGWQVQIVREHNGIKGPCVVVGKTVLSPREATAARIRALRLHAPTDPIDNAVRKLRAPKYNPASQPNFQERIYERQRILRRTSSLMLIAPRYRAVSGNC